MSVSISYNFSPTTTIESGQVNQNFTDLVNYINNTACVTGMVTMWSGDIGSIPTGWALDNNLKDKFIIGAGNTYAIGGTGGATTKDLSHVHSTANESSHNHTYSGNTGYESGTDDAGDEGTDHTYADNNHYHAYSGTTSAGSAHNHGNTGSSGSSTQDIMPPYYALAFIKKS